MCSTIAYQILSMFVLKHARRLIFVNFSNLSAFECSIRNPKLQFLVQWCIQDVIYCINWHLSNEKIENYVFNTFPIIYFTSNILTQPLLYGNAADNPTRGFLL